MNMNRPGIRVPDTGARLVRRAGIQDGFPPILSPFLKGSTAGFGFSPSSSTSGPRPGGSGSGTQTSETHSPSTPPPGTSNTTALSTAVAAASQARLSSSAVGGIAVGSSFFLLALVVIVWLVVRRRRQDCHAQLNDDGASDGSGSSRFPVDDAVPSVERTAAAKTKLAVDLLLSPRADNDAPPAYEELALHGRDAITTEQTPPEISSVSDGFRRYGLTFGGDAKGLE